MGSSAAAPARAVCARARTAPTPARWRTPSGTVTVVGSPSASVGPSCHRVRRPCPCSRKLAPAGRLATPHAGHLFGRTSSGDGSFASHHLTSSPLCTIRLWLRSLTGIYPGPRWGRCFSTGPHHYFWRRDQGPAPRPLPTGRAIHHAPRPSPSALPDGLPIAQPARRHHEPGALSPSVSNQLAREQLWAGAFTGLGMAFHG